MDFSPLFILFDRLMWEWMLLVRNFRRKDLPEITTLIADTFNRNYNYNFYLSIFEKWQGGFLIAEDERGVVGVLTAVISAPKEARILLMAVPLNIETGASVQCFFQSL
ncbi:MAG: hypothetical protein JSV56_13750 [Methanomassiliicoccales archaeon]|nr:MAG: hypothetical protein JSV56_13750 [Methanomassiliicoccales archaeon]